MKTITLILLSLLFACSSPNEPSDPNSPVVDGYSLTNPPPRGGTLQGRWKDAWNRTLSSQGLYDPEYHGYLEGEIRVKGNTVWYQFRGNMQQYTFIGHIDGGTLTGHELMQNWTASQGVTFTWPIQPYTYTRQ